MTKLNVKTAIPVYVAIVVPAALPAVSRLSIGQLTEGGRLTIAVSTSTYRESTLVVKRDAGTKQRVFNARRFAPPAGHCGRQRDTEKVGRR